jgi:hypothetical protein
VYWLVACDSGFPKEARMACASLSFSAATPLSGTLAWPSSRSRTRAGDCFRKVRFHDLETVLRLPGDAGADRFSRRDPDGDALSLLDLHLGGDEQGDWVFPQRGIDPDAAFRSDLGHESLCYRLVPVGGRAGPPRHAERRQHAGVPEFVAVPPEIRSELRRRRGVPQHGTDVLPAPAAFALPVGEDDEPVRPEHRRRAGDVAEFASRLAVVLGFPDDRRRDTDRESVFGAHRGETVHLIPDHGLKG